MKLGEYLLIYKVEHIEGISNYSRNPTENCCEGV